MSALVVLDHVTENTVSPSVKTTHAGSGLGDQFVFVATLEGQDTAAFLEQSAGGGFWAPYPDGHFKYSPTHTIVANDPGGAVFRIRAKPRNGGSVTVTVTATGDLVPALVEE